MGFHGPEHLNDWLKNNLVRNTIEVHQAINSKHAWAQPSLYKSIQEHKQFQAQASLLRTSNVIWRSHNCVKVSLGKSIIGERIQLWRCIFGHKHTVGHRQNYCWVYSSLRKSIFGHKQHLWAQTPMLNTSIYRHAQCHLLKRPLGVLMAKLARAARLTHLYTAGDANNFCKIYAQNYYKDIYLYNALDLLSTMIKVVIVKCAAFCLQLASLLAEAKPESCHVAYLNAFFSNLTRNRRGAHCIFAHFLFHFTL